MFNRSVHDAKFIKPLGNIWILALAWPVFRITLCFTTVVRDD